MQKAPLVSVVVVTYDRLNDLRKCMRSVLNQTYKNIEIILVDNGSPAKVYELIIKEFCKYSNVKVVRSNINLGCPRGRNLGIRASTGDIILTIDDDGWIEEDAIEKIVRKFLACDNKIGVLRFHIELVSNALGKVRDTFSTETEFLLPQFSGGASAFRREVFEKAGYYPEFIWGYGEEFDLSLRILDCGFYILYFPEVTFYHNPGSTTRSKRVFMLQTRNILLSVVRLIPYSVFVPVFLRYLYSHFVLSIKYSALGRYFKGILQFILLLPKGLKTRTPVSKKTVKLYYKLRGIEREHSHGS